MKLIMFIGIGIIAIVIVLFLVFNIRYILLERITDYKLTVNKIDAKSELYYRPDIKKYYLFAISLNEVFLIDFHQAKVYFTNSSEKDYLNILNNLFWKRDGTLLISTENDLKADSFKSYFSGNSIIMDYYGNNKVDLIINSKIK